MILDEWAAAWGINAAAMADLRHRVLGLDGGDPAPTPGLSEAAVQNRVRVRASQLGMRAWRNNVGVLENDAGIPIRFGLANDSPQVNALCKSGDLIGIRPRVIQPGDVGHTIGQFVSLECKKAGWVYTGTDREKAQAAWAALVLSLGGDARFITDERQL